MGATSSGKSTVANALVSRWKRQGRPVIHFDGDEIRGFFGDHLGFDSTARLKVVSTLAHLAKKTSEAGLPTIVSALTAHEDARSYVGAALDKLIIAYTKCPIDVCAERDPKHLYARAKAGEINTLIGFNTPYEPPTNPQIVIETHRVSPEQAVDQIETYLRTAGYID